MGVTAHYLDGFHEILNTTRDSGIPFPNGIKEHYVKESWFFDVLASYAFKFSPPLEPQPVSGYSKGSDEAVRGKDGESNESVQTINYSMPCWKNLINGTTVTLGCNNVFGHDPPDASTTTNYADFLYDSTGRFVYVSLTKKF